MKSLSPVRPSATPWTAAYEAPPSMGFSRQEHWNGVPLPSPIDLLLYVLALELDFVWIISFLPPSTTNPSVSPPKYILNLFTLLPSLLPLSLIQTTITSCQDESTSPSWSHIQSRLFQLISAQRPEGPFQNVNQFFVFFPCLWPNPQTVQFSSVQLLSPVQLFATPWTAARQASLSITNSWTSHKLMSIESMMPSNHLILCRSLLLLPLVFSSIRVFSNESVLPIRWPKYWSFSSASILPVNIQD